jgi:hypothetical protein
MAVFVTFLINSKNILTKDVKIDHDLFTLVPFRFIRRVRKIAKSDC